jgi:hypothetical protein
MATSRIPGHAQRQGDQPGAQGEFGRHGQALPDQLRHRQSVDERDAEIAADQAQQPAEILRQHGLIEAHRSAQRGQLFRARAVAGNEGRRVTRQHVEQQEQHDRGAEKHRQRRQRATGGKAEHRLARLRP